MPVNNPDRDWEQFGRTDPYFGVVSLERFHKDQLTPEALRDFFRSGQEHVDYLFQTIRDHLECDFAPRRALDFGCGVGRCTLPLARVCPAVTGLDVSPAMLREGELNAAAQGVHNIAWVVSDDDLSRLDGRYDFIHSFIVFQHIPPARGLPLLQKLIDRLNPNGIGVIQFLYHKDTPRLKQFLGVLRKQVPLLHNFANLYYGFPFRYPLMQKNAYDLNRVLNLIQKSGCGNCHLRFEGTGAFQSVVVFFQKKPDQVPYDWFYGTHEKPRTNESASP